MINIQYIVWLFPILFIFHDFEEIIFMKWWINKNKSYLNSRFPKLSNLLINHFQNISTASFALGVFEEFILIVIVSAISYAVNSYVIWIGLFIAFTLHLIMHFFQMFIVRKYIPAVITSTVCLPICIYLIMNIIKYYETSIILIYSVLGFSTMVINLAFIHRLMIIFESWLKKIEKKEFN